MDCFLLLVGGVLMSDLDIYVSPLASIRFLEPNVPLLGGLLYHLSLSFEIVEFKYLVKLSS